MSILLRLRAFARDADADAVASATGAFVNDEPRYLQSTGFVLDREGRVIVSVYSSGAIGRLMPEDVIGLVKYVRGHERQQNAARDGRRASRPLIAVAYGRSRTGVVRPGRATHRSVRRGCLIGAWRPPNETVV